MAEYRGVDGVARKVTKVYRGIDGVARKVTKQYRGIDGVARKFFGGEPWEEAAALVGYSPASLDALLKDSTICTAIAGNATARDIMKTNYSSNMTSYIDSNFNNGLNLLNFNCKLKCYLYKAGNQCTNITGGWRTQQGSASYGSSGITWSISSSDMTIVRTSNTIDFTNFKTLYVKYNAYWSRSGQNVKMGLSTSANLNSDKGDSWVVYNGASSPSEGATTNNATISVGTSSVSGSYYVKLTEYMWSEASYTVTNVWIIP